MFPFPGSDGHWTRRRFLTDIAFVAGALVAASWIGTKGCSKPTEATSPTPLHSPSPQPQAVKCTGTDLNPRPQAKGDFVSRPAVPVKVSSGSVSPLPPNSKKSPGIK